MEKELRAPYTVDVEKVTINTSGLAVGIYVVKVILDKETVALKVAVGDN